MSGARDRLDEVLGGVGVGFITSDAEGNIVDANDVAARMIGYVDRHELLAAPHREWLSRHELLDEAGRPFPFEHLPTRVAFRDDRPRESIVRWRKRGTTDDRWALLTATRLGDDSREARVVSVFHDVTEHVQRERARRRAKDELLAMVGHELRSPLAPILGILALRRARAEGSPSAEDITMERQVRLLARLVDDLLDASRIQSGKLTLKRNRVSLAEVVERAVETAMPAMDGRGHTLEIALEPDLWLDGDEHRLVQVLSNVLANAAKFTPPKGHVSLRAWRSPEKIVISVRDDGVGVSTALLSRLFDAFVQGPPCDDRGAAGLGLGLSIVRRIVDLHGGTVRAWSEGEGRGTEVVIELPAAERDAPMAEDGEPSLMTAEVSGVRAGPPRRVLVVEDNTDSAATICELLELSGHVVAVAHDAARALELARSAPPDVALLDIGLPGVDGYELAQQLRALPELAGVRLVALTGYGPRERRGETAPFDAHLVKPVDITQLRALVRSSE